MTSVIHAAVVGCAIVLGLGSQAHAQATQSPPSAPEAVATPQPTKGSAPAAIASRAQERAACREQAARKKLFGLGRHKFLVKCRKARRKAPPQGR